MFQSNYRLNLEAQLGSNDFKELFGRMERQYSILKKYSTIDALGNLLKAGNKKYEAKDEIMTIFLKELKKSNVVYPLINLMFWKSLMSLYRQRSKYVDDKEALFSRLQWEFYQAVINHNLERLPRKIDVNIFLNTKKKVIAWEKQNIRYKEAIKELGEVYQNGYTSADMERSSTYPEEMESYLLDMLYRKVISKMQYDLLVETKVFNNMSQKEWAKVNNVSYNTVRSLKHRAKLAIKAYEKQKEINLD